MSAVLHNLEHECNLIFAVQSFVEREEYVDVVIVCRESKLKAHSMLLATVSPLMKTLLENQCCSCKQEHVIILPDVRYSTMYLIINFLYTGYMKVHRTELDEFYEVIKMLQIDIDKLTGGNHPFKENVMRPKISVNKKYQTLSASSEQLATQSNSMDGNWIRQPDQSRQGSERFITETNIKITDVRTEENDNFVSFPSVDGEVEVPVTLDDPLDVPDFYFLSADQTKDAVPLEVRGGLELPLTIQKEAGPSKSSPAGVHNSPTVETRKATVHHKPELSQPEVKKVHVKGKGKTSKKPTGKSQTFSVSEEPARSLIVNYCKNLILVKQLPSREDCLTCISVHKDVLKNLHWESVRNTVKSELHRITRKETKLKVEGCKRKLNGISLSDSKEVIKIKTERSDDAFEGETQFTPRNSVEKMEYEENSEAKDEKLTIKSKPSPWTRTEKNAVYSYFKSDIQKCTLPKWIKCNKFVEEKNSVLKGRTWEEVFALVKARVKKDRTNKGSGASASKASSRASRVTTYNSVFNYLQKEAMDNFMKGYRPTVITNNDLMGLINTCELLRGVPVNTVHRYCYEKFRRKRRGN